MIKARVKRQKEFLPFLFKTKKEKDVPKLDLFETGLAREINKSDTIEMAVKKMVKIALLAEFGEKLLTPPESKAMIDTIAFGILHDAELRKQALIIIDRFALD